MDTVQDQILRTLDTFRRDYYLVQVDGLQAAPLQSSGHMPFDDAAQHRAHMSRRSKHHRRQLAQWTKLHYALGSIEPWAQHVIRNALDPGANGYGGDLAIRYAFELPGVNLHVEALATTTKAVLSRAAATGREPCEILAQQVRQRDARFIKRVRSQAVARLLEAGCLLVAALQKQNEAERKERAASSENSRWRTV